jgi:hypothetical protein
MRTKILLVGAAALAMGVASSNAQVYSANVVGYVQVPLVSGYNLVANTLDLDGTGTNNTVQTTFGTQLTSATALSLVGGVFTSCSYSTKSGWFGSGTNAVNAALNPGGGVFVNTGTPTTVTLVGNVLQGSLSKSYPAGYNIISSQVPIAGLMQHTLNFQPSGSITVLTYQNGVGYNPASSYSTKSGWFGAGEPNLTVGQAVVENAAAAQSWNTNFTVQ